MCLTVDRKSLAFETSEQDASTLLPVPCAETDLAVIIYTSGTTGKPKGVMLSHHNISANTDSIIDYLHLTADDSVMVILPFYYSYGASLLTTHIKAGATLVIDNRFLYPNVVLDTMEKEGVTGFAGVPSHYAILLRKSALKNYRLPKLRYVTQAGGAMSPVMIEECINILPHVQFYVMYGQTEASARLSYLEPGSLRQKMGSIGKAIPNVELNVLNEQGQKVKSGETGEIVARGENIMMGYWNAPAETALVLREQGLYTGDLAKVDEDGFIYVVSRKKDMIKCGANRISPFEIEDVVCKMQGIMECAAVGVPDEILGEAIKLFVVPAESLAVTDKDIAIFCKQNLASFKMPKQIQFIAQLPKTASGKIKREELKKQ
jgi:acyl-CoA synthetase (AMP-forming)/AMP-acid ligase II